MTATASADIKWHQGFLTRVDREHQLHQRGVTVWFTGLSGSGKSTLACALEHALMGMGYLSYRLDGDNLRFGLNGDLGFSAGDRQENIRRVGEVAKLFADAAFITIASFISPYESDRQRARAIHEKAGIPFIEVFLDVPLEVVEERDPKGLYRKARAGEIKGFTGIDDPYEVPQCPELKVDTHRLSVDEAVEHILAFMSTHQLLTTGKN